MVDIIMIRTFGHEMIERFAALFTGAGDQRPHRFLPPPASCWPIFKPL